MHRCHAGAVLGYVPAEPHFGKNTWVDLYAVHPDTGTLKRKRYKCDRIKGAAARRAYARDLANRLNMQLRSGWNPWAAASASRAMHSLREACDHFIAHKTPLLVDPSTYQSQVRLFLRWCDSLAVSGQPVGLFNRQHAHGYMDHVSARVSRNTWNNTLLHCNILWNWLVEREYVTANPFKGIRRLRKEQKRRSLISPAERTECMDWFAKHDPPMAMVCLWVFHVLLRPRAELRRMRVSDVNVSGQVVTLEGSQTKSRRVRHAAIPDVMVEALVASGIPDAPPDHYVLGKGLLPGPKPVAYNTIGLRWNKMRDALGWGPDKVLYSLRDSGIVQLISDGVDLNDVMRQADHADIATTNRYVQHYFAGGAEQVRRKASPFGGLAPA